MNEPTSENFASPSAPTGPTITALPIAPKSGVTAYLLLFFLGCFGAHRFYFGMRGSAWGMLGLFIGSVILTTIVIGLLGIAAVWIWMIVDAFLIPRWLREHTSPNSAGMPREQPAQLSQAA